MQVCLVSPLNERQSGQCDALQGEHFLSLLARNPMRQQRWNKVTANTFLSWPLLYHIRLFSNAKGNDQQCVANSFIKCGLPRGPCVCVFVGFCVLQVHPAT